MIREIAIVAMVVGSIMPPGAGSAATPTPDNPRPAARNTNVPLSHGRYCGVGNSQEGQAPIDALDAACMAHDQCAGRSVVPTCKCHQDLAAAARDVAADPAERPVIRQLARNMAAAISRVPCGDDDAEPESKEPD